MSATGEPSVGIWRSIRQLPTRTPLRVKLITAVLALVAIALAAISIAGISVLKSYLLSQADEQLGTLYSASQGQLQRSGGRYTPSPGPEHWLYEAAVNGKLEHLHPGGTLPVGQPGPAVAGLAGWMASHPGQAITVAAESGHTRWRVVGYPDVAFAVYPYAGQTVTGTLIIGLDVTNVYNATGKLTYIDLLVSVAVILGLAVVGVAVVRASLRPLDEIEKTAEAIAAGDLTRRVPGHDPHTEVGRLGRSLNTMLSQIETAFRAQASSETAARRSEERMRQFVADASHELRTPLTSIRGFAEYYRQRGGVSLTGSAGSVIESGATEGGAIDGGVTGAAASSAGDADQDRLVPPASGTPADQPAAFTGHHGNGNGHSNGLGGKLAPADLDRIMRRVEQESSRMGVLVEDMLLLARLDQQRPLEHRTVDLLTLAADAVHDARVVAPDRSINLTVGAGAALLVLGDEVRLRQVIGNLMSNALAHTPAGTPIDVRIQSGSLAGPGGANTAAVLEVIDHGSGLTREQAEHAFERFYRADQARTTGGTGLGLAIVAALVAAHGGTVWVESVPGAGATFRIALPLAPEAMTDDDHDDALAGPPDGPSPDALSPDAPSPDAPSPDALSPGSPSDDAPPTDPG